MSATSNQFVILERSLPSGEAPADSAISDPSTTAASETAPWTYESLRDAVGSEPLPAVLVDLDRFDANVRHFASLAARHTKTVRVASKSLRVPALLSRARSLEPNTVRGVMCYSIAEAAFLAGQGFDDLLVGYPSVDEKALLSAATAVSQGTTFTLMVDCIEHVEKLATFWRRLGVASALRVCVDVDIAWRPWGVHIGAQRSPVRSLEALGALLDTIAAHRELALAGVMTYESQLAGVLDCQPAAPLRNLLVRWMKRLSERNVRRRRDQLAALLLRREISLELINGGGTGSAAWSATDPWLTEITVGSGLLQPHLFDRYRYAMGLEQNFAPAPQPAICFALPIARCPQANRVTCYRGGYIASGPPGRDRAPVPILPGGLRVDPREGCGEVQTPLIVPRALRGKLNVGDPVFFRPAKAGELAEHFDSYLLLSGGRIVERVKTYRGLQQCF